MNKVCDSFIPNMVYLAPTSKEEYFAMLNWSIEQNEHPVAIRIPCNGVISDRRTIDTNYSNLNKFKVEIKGENVAIIALGDFYQLGENVIEELKNTNEEWIIVGEAVYKYEDKIKDIANIHVPAPSHNVSKASSLCSIAIEKYNNNIDVYDCYSINPLYIRKSQAEVQYDEKMKRLNDGK